MSSGTPPPNWAALYQKHKDKMWAAAARILREAGRESETGDAVHDAMRSLIASPPANVSSWEAMMLATAKRRALDLLGSARVLHEGGEIDHDLSDSLATDESIADDVAAAVDREHAGGLMWDALGGLDPRDRQVVWARIVHQRTLRDLASEFDLSEGRISQITKASLAALRSALEQQGVERW